MASYVTASITAQNTFTDWIKPKRQLEHGAVGFGFLDLVILGTWVGTVTLQKRHFHGISDDDLTNTDAADVITYTANTAKLIEDHSTTTEYRVGVATGNYTSGTVEVRLEQ